MRHPDENEMAQAEKAFDKWRVDHALLAGNKGAREIFYHGYLTRVLEFRGLGEIVVSE